MKRHGPIITSIKQVKRLITIVIGFTILLLGIALLVLPGPGIITAMLGLTILGTEFVWARNLYKRFQSSANNIKNSIFNNNVESRK